MYNRVTQEKYATSEWLINDQLKYKWNVPWFNVVITQ